jgi:hypothetical protein
MSVIMRGVIAKVWPMKSRKEELRFVPLEIDDKLVAGGKQRLRVTRAKQGHSSPATTEWELGPFAGRMVALEGSAFDDKWVYECTDVAKYQR